MRREVTSVSLEHIRISKQAREQLIRLKRHTGIEQWNVLCRWAFCRSLAGSNVELTWKVFGGRNHEIYFALLKERCLRDGFGADEETLDVQLHLHLHLGIAHLAGDKRIRDGVAAFVGRALD